MQAAAWVEKTGRQRSLQIAFSHGLTAAVGGTRDAPPKFVASCLVEDISCRLPSSPMKGARSRRLRTSATYATVRSATQCHEQIRAETMDESLPALGDLEREVMQLVWANSPVTAEAVREQLPRRLKELTVRTVLRRLEEKGYVTHTVDGRTYVYRAAEPRGQVAAKAVQRIVDWFCNGSIEEVLVGMVDTAMLDQRQLRKLADKVAKAKGGKG